MILWFNVAAQVWKKTVDSLPGFSPELLSRRVDLRANQITTAGHKQHHILQVFAYCFFLKFMSVIITTRASRMRPWVSYKAVTLTAVYESVHDLYKFDPKIQHSFPSGEEHQILEENFAQE
jgi:hypothetical protein